MRIPRLITRISFAAGVLAAFAALHANDYEPYENSYGVDGYGVEDYGYDPYGYEDDLYDYDEWYGDDALYGYTEDLYNYDDPYGDSDEAYDYGDPYEYDVYGYDDFYGDREVGEDYGYGFYTRDWYDRNGVFDSWYE